MADNILKEPIITPERILKLIPQRPPFVMVDSLFEYTNLTGTTGFLIPLDNILVEPRSKPANIGTFLHFYPYIRA